MHEGVENDCEDEVIENSKKDDKQNASIKYIDSDNDDIDDAKNENVDNDYVHEDEYNDKKEDNDSVNITFVNPS